MDAKRVDESAQVVGAEQNPCKPRHLIGYAQHDRLVVTQNPAIVLHQLRI